MPDESQRDLDVTVVQGQLQGQVKPLSQEGSQGLYPSVIQRAISDQVTKELAKNDAKFKVIHVEAH